MGCLAVRGLGDGPPVCLHIGDMLGICLGKAVVALIVTHKKKILCLRRVHGCLQ